nr:MAG TPA: hypothetical protein [Caudoviricetes sp.]
MRRGRDYRSWRNNKAFHRFHRYERTTAIYVSALVVTLFGVLT